MMLRALALTIGLLVGVTDAEARQVASPPDGAGDAYEIRVENMTASTADDGSSSSSQSGGMLIERVVAVRDDGVELEFDLRPEATAEERARDWRFPALVLKSADGSLALLKGQEMEARVDAWLTLGGMTREACGHWIFTWNAFKIECDPQSVIAMLGVFDLRFEGLTDGALHTVPGGLRPAMLKMESSGLDGAVFVGEAPRDPEAVRRERAEADVAVGEITGEPMTFETALKARSDEQVSGTISVRLVTDRLGRVTRRTTITNGITEADGVAERTTATVTVERRLLTTPDA